MMKMAFRLMEGRLMGDFEWCCCYMRESLYEGTWGGIGRKSPGDGRSSVGVRRVPSADLQGGRRRPVGQSTSRRAAAGGGVAAWGKGTEHRHDRAARRARTEADGGAEAVQQLVGADGGADGGVEAAHGGGWRRGAVEAAHGGGCRMQDAAWCLPHCLCPLGCAMADGWAWALFNRRPRRTPSIPLFAGLGGEVGRTPELAI
ncbi:hypothetical protein BDA96_05G106700 [Sorghum bicolor]|uniref:Uncharacterized protein n=2 Tax=Sorghum bicolor TaxID=4558 RepID=A0A921QXJ3_SORBI|nr:hypothetical protein BDA96_05G106700 [Sorghum bicolor]OQU83282.1 hypothetical protein SORBI_3005G102750 [Sorghum bicolor]